VRFPFTFRARYRERTHECDEFRDDKTPSIRYVFFYHARGIDDARSYGYRFCPISVRYVREMSLYTRVDVHTCVLLNAIVLCGTNRVARAFAAEMEMEFRLDFMRQ